MDPRGGRSNALAILLVALAGLGTGVWYASHGQVDEQPNLAAQAEAAPPTTVKPQDIVIRRADGILDTYTVPFPIDVVERTAGALLVSGCTESLCHDMLPIPLGDGDTILKIGEAPPQPPPVGVLPTPTVAPATDGVGVPPRLGD